MAVPPIPRNTLYRERQVKIEPILPNLQSNFPTIILSEVTNVSLSSDSDTAILLGVRDVVVQPWYFKPFVLEITGKSYMGAFSDRFLPVNVATDTDVSKLLALREVVNDRFKRGGQFRNFPEKIKRRISEVFGTTLDTVELLVSISDPFSRGVFERIGQVSGRGRTINNGINQSFRAIFDGFKMDEADNCAYMQGYTIKFTAQFADKKSVLEGAKSSENDLKRVAGFFTGQVGKLVNAARSGDKVPELPSTVPFTTEAPIQTVSPI